MEISGENKKRLYKSRRDKMIDGVCAGIAEYFGIDPTIIRIVWVLTVFIGGTGILAYIAAMIIIPADTESGAVEPSGSASRKTSRPNRFWGLTLVVIGALLLLTNLGFFGIFHLWHLSWTILFAVLFIMCGIYLILRSSPEKEEPSVQTGADATGHSSVRRLTKTRTERKILGVCGGIARYFDIDPSIVRVLYVFFIFITHGFGIIVYLVLGLILPEEEPQHVL